MKHLIAILCLLPLAAWGLERADLDTMLAAAATNQGNAYLVARTAISGLGTNALPLLAQEGSDAALSWQMRLVARIAYERMTRGKEIDALRNYDWRTHSGYDKKWEWHMIGPASGLWKIAIPLFVQTGLWYYYIELTWKCTGEVLMSEDRHLIEDWPRWCRSALDGQPEQDYLRKAMIDRLEQDTVLGGPDAIGLYQSLCKGSADAIPVLVMRYDAYNKRKVIGPEMYPGENAKIYANEFKPIFASADARHADLLEKFIADHPALAELKPKLVEVRARPAPAVKPEPPFRLGTNLVTIAL